MTSSRAEKKRALLDETLTQYREHLLAGDESGVTSVIAQGLASGLPLRSIYMDIILPSQVEIGEMWHREEISISTEHMTTQIAFNQLSYLRQRVKAKDPLHYKVIIAAVEKEPHSFGARVVADFLLMDGFQVFFIGGDTPPDGLAAIADEKKADIVGISVTLEQNVQSVAKAAASLRALKHRPKILVGGPKEITHWKAIKELTPDAVATDAPAAVAACRKLLELPGSSRSLAQYLRGLGNRILSARRELNMSQQDLADSSGLDRAYISSLENGRQNVTVGAVLKIAEALDIPIEEILVGHEIQHVNS